MSYLVLARKYRPDQFEAVTGQEHVTRTLMNAIRRERIAHAYVFTGPRGVGKTSIARIFAKSLNCRKGSDGLPGPTTKPCLQCPSCVEISVGNSLAVREIDGASHNSVDNVRELIDSFRSPPPPGSVYKVYIIDEVHMLSISAFNALLKSLEEPPPHTVFVLATTEVHKIPATVLSRCQRFDFRALPPRVIEECLRSICSQEKIQIADEALRMVARLSDGSMRDAQSLLERVRAFAETTISAEDASQTLGTISRERFHQLSAAVLNRDPALALDELQAVFSTGVDVTLFLREFVAYWRDLALAKFGGVRSLERLGYAPQEQQQLLHSVRDIEPPRLRSLSDAARDGADAALRSSFPRYALESLLVRLATYDPPIRPSAAAPNPAPDDAKEPTPAPRISEPAPQSKARRSSPESSEIKHRETEPLDWAKFVASQPPELSPILRNFLPRLGVVTFSTGLLEAEGPTLAVQTFEKQENREKLQKGLARFSGVSDWRIVLRASEGEAHPSSLLAQQQQRETASASDKKRAAAEHQAVKGIKRLFPGSTIDSIRPK